MHKTILTAITVGLASLGADDNAIQLVQPGLWHGDEVAAETGDGWWGLYSAGDGFELRQTGITVTREHDAVVDAEGQATGKRIAVSGEEQPVFLVSGVEGLEAGPVDTAFSGHKSLYPAESMVMAVGGNHYLRLEAYGNAQPGSDYHVTNYSLHVRARFGHQELRTFDALGLDAQPALLWAGDLDRDGRTDLLMDLTDHYNLRSLTLFLSSMAGERELIGLAAEWTTSGC